MKKTFGRKLRELRFEADLTQIQLAKIFNVSQHTISAWENNLQEPDIETLKSIANFFGIDMNELLCFESNIDYINKDNYEKLLQEAKEQGIKDRDLLTKKIKEKSG
ncbi:MAG TPA: helix-turn-helix transcriptional regulator [Clostridia bacterium]